MNTVGQVTTDNYTISHNRLNVGKTDHPLSCFWHGSFYSSDAEQAELKLDVNR